jgi:pyruvate/2-oxoglutarate/acetoin dehydrogenase E1 component
MAELTYRDAVVAGLSQEMERDDSVVLLGEDLVAGGVFKTAVGLYERFGAERVWNTPISEQAILGCAIGAAITGIRPVAEIMFSDFYATCWDLVVNEMAKARYMSGGQLTLPVVIRSANGGGTGFAAQHSQSTESWAMTVPGLKIAAPSNPSDAKGLLAAAIREDDPVLFFEHKALYGTKGEVPEGQHLVPLGEAAVLKEGSDVTLIGLAATIPLCMDAAAQLSESGVEVNLIDLRTLVPLDVGTVLESVAQTSRAVIVEENPKQLGWAAGVAAILAEEAFYDLDAPVVRVSGENVPLPFAPNLEQAALPTTDRVKDAVLKLAGT